MSDLYYDVEDLRREVSRIKADHRELARQVSELHRLVSRVTAEQEGK